MIRFVTGAVIVLAAGLAIGAGLWFGQDATPPPPKQYVAPQPPTLTAAAKHDPVVPEPNWGLDCERAVLPADRTICSSSELSRLLTFPVNRFGDLLKVLPHAERAKAEADHRAWMAGHGVCVEQHGKNAADVEACINRRFDTYGEKLWRAEADARARHPIFVDVTVHPLTIEDVASTVLEIAGPDATFRIFPGASRPSLGPFDKARANQVCNDLGWRNIACEVREETWSAEGVAPVPVETHVLASKLGAGRPPIPRVYAEASFDCAAARSALDMLICSSRDLAKLDRDLAHGLSTAVGTLDPIARRHVEADQAKWWIGTKAACTGIKTVKMFAFNVSAEEMKTVEEAECLERRYSVRMSQVNDIRGLPHDFVGEGLVAESHTACGLEGFATHVVYTFPQFEMPGRANTRVNRALQARAAAYAQDHRASATALEREGKASLWSSFTTYDIAYVTDDFVSILFHTELDQWVRVHGARSRATVFVDLKRDKLVSLGDVFKIGWKADAARIAYRRLTGERGFGGEMSVMFPSEGDFATMMEEEHRYVLHSDHIEILFDEYEIAAYSEGPQSTKVSYAEMASFVRPDGPLAEKRETGAKVP